jgi:hypothetical protein
MSETVKSWRREARYRGQDVASNIRRAVQYHQESLEWAELADKCVRKYGTDDTSTQAAIEKAQQRMDLANRFAEAAYRSAVRAANAAGRSLDTTA